MHSVDFISNLILFTCVFKEEMEDNFHSAILYESNLQSPTYLNVDKDQWDDMVLKGYSIKNQWGSHLSLNNHTKCFEGKLIQG